MKTKSKILISIQSSYLQSYSQGYCNPTNFPPKLLRASVVLRDNFLTASVGTWNSKFDLIS